jgi:hypothetical protein
MIDTVDKHTHKFDKPIKKKVLLHDERELANGQNQTGGLTVGYDILKQWQCSVNECQAVETYDLERTKV